MPVARRSIRLLVACVVVTVVQACAAASSPTPFESRPPASVSRGTPAAIVPSTIGASPAAISSDRSAGWQAVPAQASLAGISLDDVVWTGVRFVASGSDRDGHLFLPVSTDGVSWQRGKAIATV